MKTVLCYGDSNTWGWNPDDGTRYPLQLRWPGRLGIELGPEYHVIEEGLSGRTTVRDDPEEGADKNGSTYLSPCLASHAPLDLVVIALGSNDLKARFAASAAEIAEGVDQLIDIVLKSRSGPEHTVPHIIIVVPPAISVNTVYKVMFEGAHEKLPLLSSYYHEVARKRGCMVLDLMPVISPESADGIHLDVAEHRKICELLIPLVKQVLE
jgi:lysophospholipase L1-like esterase